MVLCYPLGREYYTVHRTFLLLARRLAETGVHALRFDYYGTGDSGGAENDITPDGCIVDVKSTVEELREVSELERVGLLGIRSGCGIAAQVAGARDDVDRLVLWDPTPDSGDPRRGMVLSSRRGRSEGGPSTLLVSTSDTAEHHLPTAEVLARWGGPSSFVHAPTQTEWFDGPPGRGGIPVDAIQVIVDWVARRGGD